MDDALDTPHWTPARIRRIATILLLGFASGLPLALTGSTLIAWASDSGVNIKTVGMFGAIGTPYVFKFLWAPLLDRLPLFPLTRLFGMRRGWILACQFALIGAILLLSTQDPTADLFVMVPIAVSLAFFSASQDIVIDAYRIEYLPDEDQAAGASALQIGYRIAMLVASGGALFIADLVSWNAAYLTMAGAMGLGVVTILLSPEPEHRESLIDQKRQSEVAAFLAARPQLTGLFARVTAFLYTGVVAPFMECMSRRGWLLILLVMIAFTVGDALAGLLTYPFLRDLGFTNTEIASVVKVWGFAATMLGLTAGAMMMDRLGLVASLWVAGIIQLLSNFMFVAQAYAGYDLTFLVATIGVENFTSAIGAAIFVAYLSKLCNVSYTATQYALLSALASVGRILLSTSSGFIADATGWAWFFGITAAAAVPGLVLLYFVTRNGVGEGERRALQSDA